VLEKTGVYEVSCGWLNTGECFKGSGSNKEFQMKVKICGITNLDDAQRSIELGASMIGFIFAQSPRLVSPVDVSAILETLDERGLLEKVKTCGIFVNESPRVMESIMRDTGLSFAQIHGDDSASLCATYSFPWYRALRVAAPEDFDRLAPGGGGEWQCPIILADSYVRGIYGGTGMSVSADTAVYMKDKVKAAGKEFFIAGGITPENVSEFISAVAPDGIDVSSGVEEARGKKSKEKLEALFRAIRETAAVSG
jgi:phosphoribosylanthranilate isomerase